MNGNHIFVDTNVLIGWWVGNKEDVNCIKYLFSLRGKRLYTSALSFCHQQQKGLRQTEQHKCSDSVENQADQPVI